MNSQYDEEIIRLFVEKDKVPGLLFKLSRVNRWREAISALTNAIVFDPRCMTQLSKKPKLDELYSLLKIRGGGEQAYILASNEETHGQILPLRDALETYTGHTDGTLVYCVQGQIGYYEADGWEGYFIVHKVGKNS